MLVNSRIMKQRNIRTLASLGLCILLSVGCTGNSAGSVFGSEEEETVNRILTMYEELAAEYHENYEVDLSQRLLDGSIPSFGETYTTDDGRTSYYESESHYYEICSGSISNIGIARIDLDKDGTDELVMGYYNPDVESSNDPTMLFAAYSVKEGKIRTIFQGWWRSYYCLAEDGSIIHYGSSGALDYEIGKNDLIENPDGEFALKEKEAVVVRGNALVDEDPEKPYYYYPDGRENPGAENSSDSMIQLNEEEGQFFFDRIMAEEVHIELEKFDVVSE